jgi:type IV secretion system protein VirB10
MMTPQVGQPRLRRWVVPVAVILGLCGLVVVVALPGLVARLSLPSWRSDGTDTAPTTPVVLPDTYREPTTTYGAKPVQARPPEPPAPVQASTLAPTAMPPPPAALLQQPSPARQTVSTANIPTAMLQQAPGLPGAAQQAQRSLLSGERQSPYPLPQAQGAGPKRWGIDLAHTQQQRRQPSAQEREEARRQEEAKKLIKSAVWATPAFPKKTLYRQQAIPGITIDEMVSDIPGQYKIRVSVPVYDRFEREVELIPKDSIVIITQKRVPGYGEKRLELAVEEIQPPTPEVISLKASVSDKEGGAGVRGNVDNHLPQLILATVISTAINVGGRVAAGNPQGYQYSVGQEVVRDAGQQVSQDAKSILDRTLRVPPTITVPAQTPVSVSLLENVTFSRKPLVVR